MSSDKYKNRSTRVEHHYHIRYGDRYDYYRSQPSIYVGGGYSSLFWYSMMDWSLERRAMWMYHNRHNIDSQLYAQQMQNAQLQARIAALEQQGVARDTSYVDPEFKDNPDLMYSDEYVSAAYNATPVQRRSSSGGGSYTFLWVLLGFVVLGGVVYLVFFKKWGEN